MKKLTQIIIALAAVTLLLPIGGTVFAEDGDNTAEYGWSEEELYLESMDYEPETGLIDPNAENGIMLMSDLSRGTRKAWIKMDNQYGYDYITDLYIDGSVSYCIEPLVLISASTGYGATVAWDELGWDTVNRMWELSKFGFGYNGQNSDAYYIATQVMIWEALGYYFDVYQLPAGTNTTPYDFSAERSQIESNIANFSPVLPSFASGTQELDYKTLITLSDTKGVLGNYNVKCGNGVSCSVSGNDLTIEINSIHYDSNITMENIMSGEAYGANLIYGVPGSQKIYVRNSYDPVRNGSMLIKLITGNISMNKLDEYGGNAEAGQEFEVWWSDADYNRLEKFTNTDESNWFTDASGKLNINNLLPRGYYSLAEVNSTKPYVINLKAEETTIVKDQTASFDFTNYRRKINLQITKTDIDKPELKLNGAGYEVTDITDGKTLTFAGESGSQYIVIEDFYNHNLGIPNAEVTIYSDEQGTDTVLETNADGNGIVKVDDLEPGTYYWKNMAEIDYLDPNLVEYNEFTVKEKEDTQGILTVPNLKYGRIYEVCEVKTPDGYEYLTEAEMVAQKSCTVITPTPDKTEDTVTFEQSNRIREITPNFYKIEEGDNQVRINGARMDMYLDASSNEESEEDKYITTCYSGMFFIKSVNEETGEPNVKELWQISTDPSFKTYVLRYTDENGEILEAKSDGSYYYRRSADVLNGQLDYYEQKVAEGYCDLPTMTWGKTYKLCEVEAPTGYQKKDSCMSVTLTPVYGDNDEDVLFTNSKITLTPTPTPTSTPNTPNTPSTTPTPASNRPYYPNTGELNPWDD